LSEEPSPESGSWDLIYGFLGVFVGLLIVGIGLSIVILFIWPARNDIYERDYFPSFRWALVIGSIVGAVIGFHLGREKNRHHR